MRQIDVDCVFDVTGEDEPIFVTEDESLAWSGAEVEITDWKDTVGQNEAIDKMLKRKLNEEDELVILFDGSDVIVYALMSDAMHC